MRQKNASCKANCTGTRSPKIVQVIPMRYGVGLVSRSPAPGPKPRSDTRLFVTTLTEKKYPFGSLGGRHQRLGIRDSLPCLSDDLITTIPGGSRRPTALSLDDGAFNPCVPSRLSLPPKGKESVGLDCSHFCAPHFREPMRYGPGHCTSTQPGPFAKSSIGGRCKTYAL